MKLPKPCLTCGRLTRPGHSRCAPCTRIYRQRWDQASSVRRRERLKNGDGAARRLRKEINEVGGATCAWCFNYYPGALVRVDHIVRLADPGGSDYEENCQILCDSCHGVKTRHEASN